MSQTDSGYYKAAATGACIFPGDTPVKLMIQNRIVKYINIFPTFIYSLSGHLLRFGKSLVKV